MFELGMKVKLCTDGEIYYIITKVEAHGWFGLAKDKHALLADLIARQDQIEAIRSPVKPRPHYKDWEYA
jgi:hypothetical protein